MNGLILAEDGKKMSKKLKNYPDPAYLFNKYGKDVYDMLREASIHVELDDRNESIGKKVRDASVEKFNYLVIKFFSY